MTTTEQLSHQKEVKTDEYGFDLKKTNDALFILYGTANQGKTSTLFYLLLLLGRKSKTINNKSLISFIKKFERIAPTGGLSYVDVRVVIPYEGKHIAITTFGDYREVCEENYCFFKKSPSASFYFYDGKDFVLSNDNGLNKEQKQLLRKLKPTIFLSACRTEGGAVDALKYCAHYFLPRISQITWIRKFGGKIDSTKTRHSTVDANYAKDLKAAIDRIIKGNKL